MNTDPKALVLDWTDALNRRDPDAAAGYLAEDCTFTNIGTGQHFVGRDPVREDFVALLAMYSEMRIEKTTFLCTSDGHFATEWIMTGVHTGDAPGLPATGKPFRISGAGVGEIRDGKLARITEYWNMAEFLIQVGVLPPPGA
jgi:Ketosteroid isomerase-related protein